ncbi:hypothetical protein H1O16_gp165 [Burkholderia phage BcepSaruman]|uniref:Uncharacterized protein n=1 Tax=Burkholderia phage BcepSaruman TaxID=2530032 RepID=A0A4D5ZHN7_9CAUD|nr:hypothetical protein H1O16_gp165 [Burkholderia phage BcepSaruman]QBX06578.1 hypothetical protein BcepSaruman_165 [Burkholderia phage BcepSaruman]
MKLYETMALPTNETLDYLRTVFNGCPFEVNFDAAYVSLNISETEMKLDDTGAVYRARPGYMGIWYDTALGDSSLILPLSSGDLLTRAQDLREEAPNEFYGNLYFPHMVLVPHMVPLKRHVRTFVNSITHVLGTIDRRMLTFSHEVQLTRDYRYAPSSDYYQDTAKSYGG